MVVFLQVNVSIVKSPTHLVQDNGFAAEWLRLSTTIVFVSSIQG